MKKMVLLPFMLLTYNIITTNTSATEVYNEDQLCWYQNKYLRGGVYKKNLNRVTATVYEAVPSQTDDTPLYTADGSHIDPDRIPSLRWCAVSRNLLKRWGGPYDYGDTIYVEIPEIDPIWGNNLLYKKYGNMVNGYWVIHDTMNKRYKNYMDFLSIPSFIWGKFNEVTIYTLEERPDVFEELSGVFDYLKD